MKKVIVAIVLILTLSLGGCTAKDSVHTTIDNASNMSSVTNLNLQFAQGINWLGQFAIDPVAPNIADAYYNTVNGSSYVWNGANNYKRR